MKEKMLKVWRVIKKAVVNGVYPVQVVKDAKVSGIHKIWYMFFAVNTLFGLTGWLISNQLWQVLLIYVWYFAFSAFIHSFVEPRDIPQRQKDISDAKDKL